MGFMLLDYKKKIIQDLVLRYVRTYVEELRDMILCRYVSSLTDGYQI
jgi:hypothetical protein